MSVEQLQLIEARVANERKSVGLAYVLWLFLGLWGIHNFYLAKWKLGVFQLTGGIIATIVLITTASRVDEHNQDVGSSFVIVLAVLVIIIWAASFFVDMFLIPRRVRQHSNRLRQAYAAELRTT